MATIITVRGYLVGTIWMPCVECFKPLTYNISREAERLDGATLRDHLLAATNDGDFSSCSIACGELVATRYSYSEGRRVTVERSWPLERFADLGDLLHPDGQDWWPPYDVELEEAA